MLHDVAPTHRIRRSRLNTVRESLHRVLAISHHNVRLRLRDPGQAISYLVLPMILMVVLKPLYIRAVPGGSTQVVIGLVVMFSVLAVGIAGSSILVERQWHTWDRLRQTRAGSAEILLGKVAPIYLLMLLQQTILLTFGCVVIGMPWPDSPVLVAVAILVWSFALLAIGAALATIARSLSELGAISDVGAMVLSSLAGALVPLSILPGWVEVAAHASPGYYALEMLRAAVAGDTRQVLGNAAVLIAVGLAAGGYAIHRLARGWGRTRLL
ncbi:ABC transporter permease [Nocardioides sp. GXZ039]|uniref:ABC transporter permease n=1 Tax=Nocardioides sp. GXZ039 TaxID=3136018 RepID=UPI0030F40A6D